MFSVKIVLLRLFISPVPVMLIGYVPVGVELVVFTVKVDRCVGLLVEGANEHVAFPGHPVCVKFTVPLSDNVISRPIPIR